MNFFQGDIVVLPFPFADQSDSKPRPALVISNSKVNKTRDIILAQITSTPRNDEFSFVITDTIVTHSLREYSEIRCHKIFTADKNLVTKKISKIKPEAYSHIYSAINSCLIS
jgi:mRNA interferase MazF